MTGMTPRAARRGSLMISPDFSATRAQSFAEILDDLATGGDAPARMRNFSHASGLDWLFAFPGKAEAEPAKDRSAGLFDEPETVEKQPAPPPNFDLDEGKIAAELGLARARSLDDLAKARRAFARRNHPDLFHANLRGKANARMQLAIMLLDRRRKEIEKRR